MVKEDFQLDYILGDPGANSRGEGKSEDDQIAERKGIGEESVSKRHIQSKYSTTVLHSFKMKT